MLIECPECKNPVSDKAPACPKCGVELAEIKASAKKVKVGSRRKATQFVWFFFWLMAVGIVWPLFSEGQNYGFAGALITIGLFGWVGALLYRMLNT